MSKMMHKTWWGEEFVSALEAYIDPGRLQRGKAYRTDKRVLAFKINGNEITATVRGNINPYFGISTEPKYKIRLKFEPISEQKWQQIIKNICADALCLSKLMLNEIPGNIEDAFGSESLLPASYKDVETSCSCPDYSDPCKHIAGIYYRIANILDTNPMLLFQLRGLAPEKLHQELKKTELGQAFSEHLTLPSAVEIEYQAHKYTSTYVKREKTTATATPLKQKIKASRFWSMPASVDLANVNLQDSSDPNLNQKSPNNVDQEVVKPQVESGADSITAWPLMQQSSNNISEISAALIKKQGDYPEFWTKTNSFISAMELFYSHTRKKNSKDLL